MSSKNHKEEKKAQIMLITLLVLMIVAIVIVSLIMIINRDIGQVSTNQKFDQIYNAAESDLQRLVTELGTGQITMANIATGKYAGKCTTPNTAIDSYTLLEARCNFSDDQYSSIAVDRRIDFRRVKKIEALQLRKDESYTVNLNGYNSTLKIEWNGNFAMDMGLIYQDGTELKMIRDVFDTQLVYTSLAGDNPYLDTNNIHAFSFTQLATSSPYSNAFEMNIAATNGLGGLAPKYLVITPRSSASGVVEIHVTPTNTASLSSYPYQLREIISTGTDLLDSTSPVAKLKTTIPLISQADSIFDYAFITNDSLDFSN